MNSLILTLLLILALYFAVWSLIERDRENAIKSPYYNPNKVGKAVLRNKKNKPRRKR